MIQLIRLKPCICSPLQGTDGMRIPRSQFGRASRQLLRESIWDAPRMLWGGDENKLVGYDII